MRTAKTTAAGVEDFVWGTPDGDVVLCPGFAVVSLAGKSWGISAYTLRRTRSIS